MCMLRNRLLAPEQKRYACASRFLTYSNFPIYLLYYIQFMRMLQYLDTLLDQLPDRFVAPLVGLAAAGVLAFILEK